MILYYIIFNWKQLKWNVQTQTQILKHTITKIPNPINGKSQSMVKYVIQFNFTSNGNEQCENLINDLNVHADPFINRWVLGLNGWIFNWIFGAILNIWCYDVLPNDL